MTSIEKSVVVLAFVVRFIVPIGLSGSSSNLQNSIELSTLITSFRSLKEGIYLYSNNINIYDGGVVHHSPLLILLMDFLIDSTTVFYPIIDAIITYTIINIAKLIINKDVLKKRQIKLEPWIIGLVYALNPISVLSNIGRSTIIFSNLFIALSLYNGLLGSTSLSAISISIAAYLTYTPIYLVIPLIKLTRESKNSVPRFIAFFTSSFASLLFISFQITGDWEFLKATYGDIILFQKIAPNLGLWWYYFTEMFEFFIPFYTEVFNLYSVVMIIPLTLRLDGTFAFVLSLGWLNFTKPYTELGDLALYLSLLLLLQSVFKHLTYFVLSALLLLISTILGPIFYHVWIDLGSGNSNFFYAITLVYSLGVASTIADFTWGFLLQEYHEANEGENINVKITQI